METYNTKYCLPEPGKHVLAFQICINKKTAAVVAVYIPPFFQVVNDDSDWEFEKEGWYERSLNNAGDISHWYIHDEIVAWQYIMIPSSYSA